VGLTLYLDKILEKQKLANIQPRSKSDRSYGHRSQKVASRWFGADRVGKPKKGIISTTTPYYIGIKRRKEENKKHNKHPQKGFENRRGPTGRDLPRSSGFMKLCKKRKPGKWSSELTGKESKGLMDLQRHRGRQGGKERSRRGRRFSPTPRSRVVEKKGKGVAKKSSKGPQ